jgi:hypothetical protein
VEEWLLVWIELCMKSTTIFLNNLELDGHLILQIDFHIGEQKSINILFFDIYLIVWRS